jgi:hypothetical protein
MDDLISRQAAIDALTHKWDGMVTSVFDVLKELPSAQLERKKGKWVRDEFGSKCSCCGLYAYRDKFGEPWESDYCPNCGSYNREEKTYEGQ